MGITLNIESQEPIKCTHIGNIANHHHHPRHCHRTCRKGDVRTPNGKTELRCGILDKIVVGLIGCGDSHRSHNVVSALILGSEDKNLFLSRHTAGPNTARGLPPVTYLESKLLLPQALRLIS